MTKDNTTYGPCETCGNTVDNCYDMAFAGGCCADCNHTITIVDNYDFAADDMAFDAAREDRYR